MHWNSFWDLATKHQIHCRRGEGGGIKGGQHTIPVDRVLEALQEAKIPACDVNFYSVGMTSFFHEI